MADTPTTTPDKAAFAVAVGPVMVPEIIDRPQMVVRVAENRVEMSELNRWAEPLKRALPRAIAASIAQNVPAARVYLPGNDNVAASDYRVRIDIERFESELGKGATVEAAWSVSGGGAAGVRHGRSLVREAAGGPGYDELVAAHSAAAAAIGREIAAAIAAAKP
jgi:uncharacterized lipoprotein YmbA